MTDPQPDRDQDRERAQAEERAARGDRRGYSWEPFQEGHTLSVRHGAYSPRLLETTIEEIVREAAVFAPWLADSDSPEVRSWIVAEARARRLAKYVEEHGALNPDGSERDASKALARWSRIAAEHRERLGLNPKSRLDLASKVADSQAQAERVEELRERGRAIREAREREALKSPTSGPDSAQGERTSVRQPPEGPESSQSAGDAAETTPEGEEP